MAKKGGGGKRHSLHRNDMAVTELITMSLESCESYFLFVSNKLNVWGVHTPLSAPCREHIQETDLLKLQLVEN